MTSTPLLAELGKVDLQGVPRALQNAGPVIVADGVARRLGEVKAVIRADRARVVGLRPAHLAPLVAKLRTKALALYGIQVEDLSPLQRLDGLEWLSLTWNTRRSLRSSRWRRCRA